MSRYVLRPRVGERIIHNVTGEPATVLKVERNGVRLTVDTHSGHLGVVTMERAANGCWLRAEVTS